MTGAHVPPPHAAFLERAVPRLAEDPRLLGVAAAGSYARGQLDAFSDVDLVIAVDPAAVAEVAAARREIAAGLGPLVAAFTGEHVGEPRVLICLYAGDAAGAPLHVDLKFVALDDVGVRVDDPVVLWARDERFGRALRAGDARYPHPEPQWVEDRFWVWVHYGAAKVGRGELFEAVDFLAFLRMQVLGPLALAEANAPPCGVRRLETAAPARARAIAATVAPYDAAGCLRGLAAAVDAYRSLRAALPESRVVPNAAAERVAVAYLCHTADQLGVALPAGLS